MTDTTPQITASANPAPDQIKSATRILVASGAAWAVGKGYIAGDLVAPLTTLLLVGGPLLWGQIETRMKKAQLHAAAIADPGNVTVKP